MYVYEFITGVIKIFFTKFGDHVIATFFFITSFLNLGHYTTPILASFAESS